MVQPNELFAMATIETWPDLISHPPEIHRSGVFNRVRSVLRYRLAHEVTPPPVPPFLMLEHLLSCYIANADMQMIASARDAAVHELIASKQIDDTASFLGALDYFAAKEINVLRLLRRSGLHSVTYEAVIEAHANTSEAEECGVGAICFTSLDAFYAVSEQNKVMSGQPVIPVDAFRSAFNF